MKCKYCGGEIKGKICSKCLMPIDVDEKTGGKNYDSKALMDNNAQSFLGN